MSKSCVTTGAPCNTALIPPTTRNSTWASVNATITCSTKFCTAHCLLHEQPPPLVPAQPLGGSQRQTAADLRQIDFTLVSQVKIRRSIGF
jgi:hypothetical protein